MGRLDIPQLCRRKFTQSVPVYCPNTSTSDVVPCCLCAEWRDGLDAEEEGQWAAQGVRQDLALLLVALLVAGVLAGCLLVCTGVVDPVRVAPTVCPSFLPSAGPFVSGSPMLIVFTLSALLSGSSRGVLFVA